MPHFLVYSEKTPSYCIRVADVPLEFAEQLRSDLLRNPDHWPRDLLIEEVENLYADAPTTKRPWWAFWR
jgi:hypothetical protein